MTPFPSGPTENEKIKNKIKGKKKKPPKRKRKAKTKRTAKKGGWVMHPG